MDTMNIALPESMKEFVQIRVASGGYSSASEYIRALIRCEAANVFTAIGGLHNLMNAPDTT